ncbi:DUF4271 domain-containing protein [Tenacibaculum holothuriorum]|uniref:DUF4271 domain-containing protein n=1 Tax=Tenacibaculum holothuriorum TaxID=1635173 RepID=UPI000A323BB2|nr:DUF4271 domain-containing protein [Tenacibaculum holothuriorum]
MLITNANFKVLQALDRLDFTNSWITVLILISVVLLAVMKVIKPSRLLGYSIAFFSPGFFQKRAEENASFFTPFNGVMFLFSLIILSLFCFFALNPFAFERDFFEFGVFFIGIIVYVLIRFIIDFLVINATGVIDVLNYFMFSKRGYLYTVSLWMFPVLIFYIYAFRNNYFLLISFLLLFAIRGFLLIYNNKKLVVSKLFYFILYFCTLEIAPLLILYKITTT